MAKVAKLGLSMVVLVALTGCGTRWTSKQEAAFRAGSSRAATSDGLAAGDQSDAAVAADDGGITAVSGNGPATANGATQGATGNASSTALPCAAASKAPGVTDKQITIGLIDSLSGPSPGLGQTHLSASKAYVAYRNAHGGVCGRQIKLITADDGLDSSRNRAIMSEFEPQVFAMASGIAGGGDGGVDIVNQKRLPMVGIAITPILSEQTATYFGVRPLLPSYDVPDAKHRYLHDTLGIRKAAVVYLGAAAAPQEAAREKKLLKAAGIDVVMEQSVPVTQLSYDSTARAVANSGAEFLFFAHDQGASANMARAMTDTGYKLKMAEYIIAYGSNFTASAGASAEGAVSWIDFLPNEDHGNKEQALFKQWLEQTAPDTFVDRFASEGWSGSKILFDAIDAIPGPLTRDALLNQLKSVGVYDANGYIAPIQFGAKQNKGCLIAMQFHDGAWRRLYPSAGFAC